jgi:hypothetical protein
MTTPPSPGFPYWLAALAAVLAVVLARSRPEHRPIAIFLVASVAIDILRAYLRARFDLGVPGPYEGMRRAAFHVDEAGFVAWPAGLAALALVVFAHRPAWPPFALWSVVCVTLIALYPSDLVRGPGLQRAYLAAYLGGLATMIATGVRWWTRGRDKPGPHQAVLLLLGFVDVARLVPFYGSVFDRWATYAPPTNVALYAVVSAVEGGFLWQSSRTS